MNSAHEATSRTGVLLINLGTPDEPTAPAIRRFLRQFLSDRRVVEIPRAIWLLVLYLFILPFRPRRLAHAYASVWSPEGSPLLAISRQQQRALASRLGPDIRVGLAMNYGEPSIANALTEFDRDHVRRILVLPLYPQYSGTTTAAAFDALFDVLRQRRWVPDIRTLNSYHDEPAYIEALASSLRSHWSAQGRGDHLLISFHSIPRQYLDAGDPYFCFCHKTARLLAAQLGLAGGSWSVSFQSRLGRAQWLQPYTDLVIPQLAKSAVKTLDVICPGFSADCLETLEEVAIRYAGDFLRAGGVALRYVPALNASEVHIEALSELCQRHLAGWSCTLDDAEPVGARLARVERLLPSLDSETLR
ncbi:MAG: ferrochelatase [Panacagrimonas sp.]